MSSIKNKVLNNNFENQLNIIKNKNNAINKMYGFHGSKNYSAIKLVSS